MVLTRRAAEKFLATRARPLPSTQLTIVNPAAAHIETAPASVAVVAMAAPTDESSPSFTLFQQTLTKLPPLGLQMFKGETGREWFPWWSAFQAAVHNNTSISQVEKFGYLSYYTTGAAARTIAGYAYTADNYEKAIKALLQRFGRTETILTSHYAALSKLPEVNEASDVHGLRALYDDIKCHVRSLKALEITPEKVMLTPIILSKIPKIIAVDWYGTECWESQPLGQLLKFIRRALDAREIVEMNRKEMRGAKGGASVAKKGKVAANKELLPR